MKTKTSTTKYLVTTLCLFSFVFGIEALPVFAQTTDAADEQLPSLLELFTAYEKDKNESQPEGKPAPVIEEEVVTQVSYENPFQSIWDTNGSGSNVYAYAGLGATTTLLLLLSAIFLGGTGFSLVLSDSISQLRNGFTPGFRNNLVSNQ